MQNDSDTLNKRSLTEEEIARIASQVVALQLVAKTDETIDLTSVNQAHAALSRSLYEGFLGQLSPLLNALPEDDRSISAILQPLLERVATLEADVFLIKSALVNNQRFIMADAAKYVDPLMALEAGWKSQSVDERPRLKRLSVPLGPRILGHGWHPVETRPNGTFWRWSGPNLHSSLVLPSLGPGRYRISWNFHVINRRQLDGLNCDLNGQPVHEISIDWLSDTVGTLRLNADISPDNMSSYIFLDIHVSEVIPRRDTAGEERYGIGLGVIEIERDP